MSAATRTTTRCVARVMDAITDPKQMDTYSTPEQIAEVVYEAATDGKDQLRYVAGPTPRRPMRRACSSETKPSARQSRSSSSGSRRKLSVPRGTFREMRGSPRVARNERYRIAGSRLPRHCFRSRDFEGVDNGAGRQVQTNEHHDVDDALIAESPHGPCVCVLIHAMIVS